MHTTEATEIANPFALMLNPEAVFQAIERSDRLDLLQRRVCRPLDKPLLQRATPSDLGDFDHTAEDEFGADAQG